MNVYLAIPNYNMGSELKRLLPTVLNRGYAHIYVLDDHSTDDSEEIVKQFGSAVTFARNPRNIGAGATRNQIMRFQQKGIVHFLDADMELKGQGNITTDITNAFKRHPEASVIGFRVYNPDGSQYDWNFGPHLRLVRDAVAFNSWRFHAWLNHPKAKSVIQRGFAKQWKNYWTYMHPEDAEHEQQVGVVVECNMAARLEDFVRVKGFDRHLRFHEIYSLAYRLYAIGKQVWYAPRPIALKHDEKEVRRHRKREYHTSLARVTAKRLTRRYKK